MNNDQVKTQLLRKIAQVNSDVREIYRDIESLVRAEQLETLYQVALALEENASPLSKQQWSREAIFDYIERVLSLAASFSAVETVLKLLQIDRKASVQIPRSSLDRSRLLASLVASAQPLPVLLRVFERYSNEEQHREFLSCLLQEMVVHGEHLEDTAIVRRFHSLLQEQRHPLAWLPVILTTLERDLELPAYTLTSSSYCHPSILPNGKTVPVPSPHEMKEAGGIFVEMSTNAGQEIIKAAVRNWEQESNGRCEARIFLADAPIHGVISPQVLLSLRLECLEGTPPASIVVQEVTPPHVFEHLFAAAVNGGAYNYGHKGAWGRLEAWQSLSGLVGAEEQASIEQLLEQARQCQWYWFGARSPWFNHVAWDLGLISVRSDRRSLAVLAATDTD